MQNSFLPGHGEGNCRVTNPADVTDKKIARKCKTVFYQAMEKAIAAWLILLTSQTKKGAKMQNSFLPGHGEGNCRVTNPDITEELGGLSLRAFDQPVPEGGVEEHQRPVRSAEELLIKT
jgi:hypothetical protein